MPITIKLEGFNAQEIADKIINNDAVGKFMAETTAKHMKKYVPEDSGILATSYNVKPFEVEYVQPYAHYMYEGQVYGPNKPIYKDGVLVGFYSPPIKSPTGRALKFTKPTATDHWDRATQRNDADKIAQEVTGYLKSR